MITNEENIEMDEFNNDNFNEDEDYHNDSFCSSFEKSESSDDDITSSSNNEDLKFHNKFINIGSNCITNKTHSGLDLQENAWAGGFSILSHKLKEHELSLSSDKKNSSLHSSVGDSSTIQCNQN